MSSTAIYLYQTGLGLEAYFVPRRKHAQPNLGLLYRFASVLRPPLQNYVWCSISPNPRMNPTFNPNYL